jgi:uncharacterized protein YjbI with pentapeptide repeats
MQLLLERDLVAFNERASRERPDLENADLRMADLHDATLREANLRGAYLRQADLRAVDLSEADLDGASIHEARISGTLFPSDIHADEISLSVSMGTRMRARRPDSVCGICSRTIPAQSARDPRAVGSN